jgi:hypothetical protein
MQNKPQGVVYDAAGDVGAHAAKRDDARHLFGPDRGFVLPPTDENIRRAKNMFALPRHLREPLVRTLPGNKICLFYDRFHQTNSSAEVAIMRRLDLVKEAMLVNSEACEQFNRVGCLTFVCSSYSVTLAL